MKTKLGQQLIGSLKEVIMKDLQKKYVELARKLGKIPTRKEVRKLLGVHIEDFTQFKNAALEKHPELQELETPVRMTDKDVDAYRLELYKSNVKNANKNHIQKSSAIGYLEQFAEKVFKGNVKPVKPFPTRAKVSRILNLVFSDVHIGADLRKEETGNANYGPVEESRRVAAIVREVINYKPQYRETTELEVMLLGDLMQGQLHDPRDGAPLAEQICRVVHVFAQALQQLAANFPKVRVHCATGNHSRNTARHHNRAVNQKWDSFETVIYFALKTALVNQKNIEFNIPKTPYGYYEVFGQKIFYTHGDTVLNPGYPNKSINIKGLESQLNTINASLEDTKEIKVAIVGHVHVASQTYLANGATMITNGALIEPDQYAVSIGIVETQTGQMLFESFPGFAVGDTRYIRVGKKEDVDVSLDKIITPWTSL